MQLVLLAILCFVGVKGQFLNDVFDESFLWATSTSAHQVEGGWDAEGKGENIWDRYCHLGNVADGHTADVACDSFNRYMDDIANLQELGVDYYRFSIAWSRILPTGTLDGGVNQPGLDYYNRLIDALLAVGIKSMVTLYHWDLPQPLQDLGGWENDQLVQHFTDYADTCFQNFGDRVDLWLTFNEPWVTAWLGYGSGGNAPSIENPGWAPYRVSHIILKSHAEAWHLYDQQYRPTQGGSISITLDAVWTEPISNDTLDLAAADRSIQFRLGWYAEPIFGAGDYPAVMREQVDSKSLAQGLNQSRLPTFTAQEVQRIRGTFDYFGLNHYTTNLIQHGVSDISCVSWACDMDTVESADPSWPTTGSSWLRVVPWGLRKLLSWIKNAYGDVPIFVTENGCSDRNATLNDTHRVNYYREYINAVLQANKTDNVNTIGYTAWSLMDNFEWAQGYNEKFGIYHVDFSDPSRPRTAKQSAREYSQIIQDNGFPASADDDLRVKSAAVETRSLSLLICLGLVFVVGCR